MLPAGRGLEYLPKLLVLQDRVPGGRILRCSALGRSLVVTFLSLFCPDVKCIRHVMFLDEMGSMARRVLTGDTGKLCHRSSMETVNASKGISRREELAER